MFAVEIDKLLRNSKKEISVVLGLNQLPHLLHLSTLLGKNVP